MSEPQNGLSGQQMSKSKAIRNLGGMTWLYEKHVCIFCCKYYNATENFRSLLSCGETREARMLAHSIKGLAGTLGFDDLHLAAKHLESELASGRNVTDSDLEIFDAHLNQILNRTYTE